MLTILGICLVLLAIVLVANGCFMHPCKHCGSRLTYINSAMTPDASHGSRVPHYAEWVHCVRCQRNTVTHGLEVTVETS